MQKTLEVQEKENKDKVIFDKVQNGKINKKVKMENSQKII